jgi:hypothetical protein
LRQRFFGVGTVRPDPREAMVDAAELTARIIRSFAAASGSDQMVTHLDYLCNHTPSIIT